MLGPDYPGFEKSLPVGTGYPHARSALPGNPGKFPGNPGRSPAQRPLFARSAKKFSRNTLFYREKWPHHKPRATRAVVRATRAEPPVPTLGSHLHF